jgi:hypothetical protein
MQVWKVRLEKDGDNEGAGREGLEMLKLYSAIALRIL